MAKTSKPGKISLQHHRLEASKICGSMRHCAPVLGNPQHRFEHMTGRVPVDLRAKSGL
jgi:hypothetical protein